MFLISFLIWSWIYNSRAKTVLGNLFWFHLIHFNTTLKRNTIVCRKKKSPRFAVKSHWRIAGRGCLFVCLFALVWLPCVCSTCVFLRVSTYVCVCECVCELAVCGQTLWADLGPRLLLAFSMSVKKQLEAKPTPVPLRSSALPAATESRTFRSPASPCQQVLAPHGRPDLHTWPTKSPESPLLSPCDEQVIYNPSVCVFLRVMGPG